jgi:hypothetical protein
MDIAHISFGGEWVYILYNFHNADGVSRLTTVM